LTARHDAFVADYERLCERLRGQPEDHARVALLRLLDEHGQRLSPVQVELWTMKVVDPHWGAEDPDRLARLMQKVGNEPSEN